MLFHTTSPEVADKRGNPVSVNQPLVARPNRPTGGWGVIVTVNGNQIEVGGKDSFQIARRLARILADSGTEFTDNDVWTTLNCLWLPQTREPDLLVDLDAFKSSVRITHL